MGGDPLGDGSKGSEGDEDGSPKYFLGIEIFRKPNFVILSQWKYVLDLLKETSLLMAKPIRCPMTVGDNISCWHMANGVEIVAAFTEIMDGCVAITRLVIHAMLDEQDMRKMGGLPLCFL
ncbi:hypothetical protein KSP39_PZI023370 [Platanthera zijinensis]|uniref:Uncharacterized protein n=1 Tax=Platanthera zijinensis TaxID=2320716 RepID=A0AAP0AWM3_9ASPA